MTRFEVAENKILKMKICMKCNSRNALRATRCRKCSYKNLRMKAKESRSS